MKLLIAIVLLVLGFIMLIKGADWFVDGSAGIAARFGIPQLVIGLTIVAMGTSAPEAAVSISAGLKGSADLAVSNVVGSNILNIGIILGISALITPLAVQKATRKFEMPYVMIVTVILMLLGMFDGKLGWVDGLILWAGMILFLVYLLNVAKKGKNEVQEEEQDDKKKKAPLIWLIAKILIGGAAIVFGSDFAGKLKYPYASAISTVTLGNLFTRMDGFAYLIFFASVIVKITVCIKIIAFCIIKERRFRC